MSVNSFPGDFVNVPTEHHSKHETIMERISVDGGVVRWTWIVDSVTMEANLVFF
jgi:hypothetical protein